MTAPALDVMAVLEALQQQLSDLTGVVQAQQRALDRLTELAPRPALAARRPRRAPDGR